MHKAGIKVILHCFEYGRDKQQALNNICEEVYYYKRKKGIIHHFSKCPYIVSSRSDKGLLKNLLKDEHPILFEGLHTTFFLKHPKLLNRKKILRTHNIEHEYYINLYNIEKTYFRKVFFRREARKLLKYEKIASYADMIFSISKNDTVYFEKKYSKTHHIPAFHPFEKVEILESTGDYALYHGNLSVSENIYAAEFLVNNVFDNIDYPLVIAGRNPSDKLVEAISKNSNIQLKTNLSDEEIKSLIKNAQINILPTFQKTGLKLKLLNSLFIGRHCLVNENMVENTGLEDLCIICNHADEMKLFIENLRNVPLSEEMINRRKNILENNFANNVIAQRILEVI